MAKMIDDSNFTYLINSEKPVVVDFWAQWCGPCKMLLPIIEELSTEIEDTVDIYKCNVDENPSAAAEYGVQSIPTLILFKKGEVIATRTGAAAKNVIKQWIESNI